MFCQHCGHKKLPPEAEWPHVCDDLVKQGKLKELEPNYCANCGEPIVGRSYYHECGKHQLRDFWTKSLHYRGVL